MVHLFARARALRGKPSDCDRPLGLGIDLSIRAVEWRQQEQAAIQALGVANRGNGHVKLRALARERGQIGGDKYGRHILDDCRGGRNLRAHALHDIGEGLSGEYGLLAVAGLGKADHHAIADQGIFPHSFDAGQIPDFDRNLFVRKERDQPRQTPRIQNGARNTEERRLK